MSISAIRASARPARTEAQARAIARPAWVLGTMIVASTVVRAAIASAHSTSRYFPDEYIYTALSRSIAHGSLTIRGNVAHFPGLLEPLVAAPLWGFFSTETAYRLVQAENALAASLAVIPIYMIARDLKLSRNYAYLCCLYALVIPMLVMIPFTISDFVGYPLALGAIAAAVKAIDRPSPKRQLVFLAFATLATLARVEYFVLVPGLSRRCDRDRAPQLPSDAAHGAPRAAPCRCRRGRSGHWLLLECPGGGVSPGGLDLDSPPGVPACRSWPACSWSRARSQD